MKKIIIANWKMNPCSKKEALSLFSAFQKYGNLIICPPFPYLNIAKGKFSLGSQDCFFEERGSFTGQVSPLMLKDLKVRYILIGHSEKRLLGESNDVIAKKIKTVLKAGLVPVLCVGESQEERKKGQTFTVLEQQIKEAVSLIPKTKIDKIMIAYEPIWAIGSKTACPVDDVLTAILFIRKLIARVYGKKKISILYGGSVNSNNVKDYLSEWIDGLLVGSASLDKKELSQILNEI